MFASSQNNKENANEDMSAIKQTKYACPYCQELLTEDELWAHCPRYHGDENKLQVCPICAAQGDKSLKGDKTWGYSSHLHYKHGPPQETKGDEKAPTYAFSLVIIQHPTTQKFVLVKEGCKQGWWLPAGRVDPGETFQQAAHRETMEEAGCEIVLKGILRIEYSPFADGGARQRIIFFAHPKHPDASLKTIPDFESQCAEWISYEDLLKELKNGTKHLRGNEPFYWFKYVTEKKPIYPMSILKGESDE